MSAKIELGHLSERVLFRCWKSSGDVIALFLDQSTDDGYVGAYESVGQHADADYGVVLRKTRPAKPAEYAMLLKELEGAPYFYKLRVVQRYAH